MARWSTRRKLQRSCDQPIADLSTHSASEVTVAVLAAFKQVTPRTIIRMLPELRAHRVGREWRIPIGAAREAFGAVSRATTTTDIGR